MKRAVWVTGVPNAGKTSVSEQLVTAMRREFDTPCALVDASVIRRQFWPHLSMSPSDRTVNIMGIAELAGVFIRAGNDVVIACIAPDREVRRRALGIVRLSAQDVAVYQVHVKAPLHVLESRDSKGLYKAYAEGTLHGLTGMDAPYDAPTGDEALHLDTSQLTVAQCTEQILAYLRTAEPISW